jgi:hypothetical protein
MGKKRYSRQQIRKLHDKKCYFCDLEIYEVLDCHRLLEGSKNGKYSDWLNTIAVCCNCHRKIHTELIVIHGRFLCTNGQYVIIYKEGGVEKIK